MNADIRWIDNPENIQSESIAAHSDHDYFTNYEALNSTTQLNTVINEWKFCFSRNVMSRLADFYKRGL